MLSFECTSILVYNYLQKLALQYDDKNGFIFKINKDRVQLSLDDIEKLVSHALIFPNFRNFRQF